MRAVGTITWNEIRDWLAEAGSICGGLHIEYLESQNARHDASFRERVHQPKLPPEADPAIRWVIGDREL